MWHYKKLMVQQTTVPIYILTKIKTSIRLNSSLLSNTLIIKLKIYKEKHVPKTYVKKIQNYHSFVQTKNWV